MLSAEVPAGSSRFTGLLVWYGISRPTWAIGDCPVARGLALPSWPLREGGQEKHRTHNHADQYSDPCHDVRLLHGGPELPPEPSWSPFAFGYAVVPTVHPSSRSLPV